VAEADDVKRWRRNRQDELDSAELYRRIAVAEEDEALASVYRRLAEAEERLEWELATGDG
jgi:vacuolar iron transporter family protein